MEVRFIDTDLRENVSLQSREIAAHVIKLINFLGKFGHSIRMPYSKQIQHNLFELRGTGKGPVRILYCFHDNTAVLLHVFIKKTAKTPRREIKIALHRRKTLTR